MAILCSLCELETAVQLQAQAKAAKKLGETCRKSLRSCDCRRAARAPQQSERSLCFAESGSCPNSPVRQQPAHVQ